MSKNLKLAVNGTLMRGLELHKNLEAAGAKFSKEARTAEEYRLWSIADRHPAMMRVKDGGRAIAVEVYEISGDGLAMVLAEEPPGLCVGKVKLEDGEEVLGVLGEPHCCETGKEITEYGGWREYISKAAMQ